MNLGVQYYRPPFPVDKFWPKDMDQIRNSGIDTIQLWLVWAWIESKPGTFNFDDYDKIIDLAESRGLKVILSTCAELHPYWIHKEAPGSEMVDHTGRTIISGNRCENHFGLTPGGCTDHPVVWERMKRFLTESVTHFRGRRTLIGWDAWNELRWNVHADSLVCFCPHTLAKFRSWLDNKFGGLDNLNKVWMRRYNNWDEVRPGLAPDRTYTEMMAWQHFITARADEHGRLRYEVMKPLDPKRDITVHAGQPSVFFTGGKMCYTLDRGNDWNLADGTDGVGTSSFPKWFGIDDAGFGMRIEVVKSAAQGKKVWLSEIQGGRSAIGFQVYAPVDAASQQRWIWNGVACGADTLLFWCWRDEVFGRESAGFGLAGNDGRAGERLEAMRRTGDLFQKHQTLLSQYRPFDAPKTGVLFSPQTYYLEWSQDGSAARSVNAQKGIMQALVRSCIPFRVVEETHLKALEGLSVLFLPHLLVTDKPLEDALIKFVKNGGTLVCESECGAFSSEGFYRYSEERFLAKLCANVETGRRNLDSDTIEITLGGKKLTLKGKQWWTPVLGGKPKILAKHKEGALAAEYAIGKGKVVRLGGYLAEPYMDTWNRDYELLVGALCRESGYAADMEVLSPEPEAGSFVYVKYGESQGKRMVFVFFPDKCGKAVLKFRKGFFKSGKARELVSDRPVKLTRDGEALSLTLKCNDIRVAVLLEE